MEEHSHETTTEQKQLGRDVVSQLAGLNLAPAASVTPLTTQGNEGKLKTAFDENVLIRFP